MSLINYHQPPSTRTSTGRMHSSVSGVIFFSGSSSSANSFLYFSQFCPVALGILERFTVCLSVIRRSVDRSLRAEAEKHVFTFERLVSPKYVAEEAEGQERLAIVDE